MFDFKLQLDENFLEHIRDFNPGIWRPIFWTPYNGAFERFLVSIVISLNGETRTFKIIPDSLLKNIFGQKHKKAEKIIEHINNIIKIQVSNEVPLDRIKSFSHNFLIGEIEQIAARSYDEAIFQIIDLHSSIITRESYLGDKSSKIKNTWATDIQKAFERNYPSNHHSFNKKINFSKRDINCGFITTNNTFFSNFTSLSAISDIGPFRSKAYDTLLIANKYPNANYSVIIKHEDKTDELEDIIRTESKFIDSKLPPLIKTYSAEEAAEYLHTESIRLN